MFGPNFTSSDNIGLVTDGWSIRGRPVVIKGIQDKAYQS